MKTLISATVVAAVMGAASAAAAATVYVAGTGWGNNPALAAQTAYTNAAVACQNLGGTPTSGISGNIEREGAGFRFDGYITCEVP